MMLKFVRLIHHRITTNFGKFSFCRIHAFILLHPFSETVAAAHLVPIQIKDKIKKQDSWNYLNRGNEDIE